MPLPFALMLGIQFMAGAWISCLPAWPENPARLFPCAALQKEPWEGRKEKQLFHAALLFFLIFQDSPPQPCGVLIFHKSTEKLFYGLFCLPTEIEV